MTLLLLRTYRALPATVCLLVGSAVAVYLASGTPPELRYAAVSNAGPSILVLSVSSSIAAALMIMPQSEPLQLTASRRIWPLRSSIAFGHGGFVLLAAVASSFAIQSSWFLFPIARAALLCAAATFALSSFLPVRYVSAIPLAYLLACYYVARGEKWWDLVLSHPSINNWMLSVILGLMGWLTFIVIGERRIPPLEDYE